MNNQLLINCIDSYSPTTKSEEIVKGNFRNYVINNNDCLSRDCRPGHITASTWLLDSSSSKVLLTKHKKLNKWLQLGGHADLEPDPIIVALKETEEESGISELCVLQREPIHLDIHEISPNHFHYDLRFCLKAGHNNFIVSDESDDLKWFSLNKLDEYTSDKSVLILKERCEKFAV